MADLATKPGPSTVDGSAPRSAAQHPMNARSIDASILIERDSMPPEAQAAEKQPALTGQSIDFCRSCSPTVSDYGRF